MLLGPLLHVFEPPAPAAPLAAVFPNLASCVTHPHLKDKTLEPLFNARTTPGVYMGGVDLAFVVGSVFMRPIMFHPTLSCMFVCFYVSPCNTCVTIYICIVTMTMTPYKFF